MKRILSALALALLAASASAFDVVVQDTVATGVNPVGPFDVVIAGFIPTNGQIGKLVAVGGPGDVTYTFLGKEAGFNNSFFSPGGSPASILDSAPVGTTATQSGISDLLNFSFATEGIAMVTNGFATNVAPTFAIFSGVGTAYKYILAVSDGGGGNDRDFDDMVIGVSAVPEPHTYALLLAGLGVVAFVARRRRPI